ncbi:MRP1-like protein [Mya arenaria]|uniref:MRP1-like protein n=1 Tax=Mya arenaria TaxID=6604 RepID=A0ABY7DSX3_MYAAR|nr:MRP1-like protein [Mya arenaria]
MLVSFFVQIARIHGVTFSRAMVNFWLLSAIVGLATIYKRIIEEDMNGSQFKLECLAVATIMLEVLLSSIAESAQTKEKEPVDKKQCPEVRASLISRIFLLWVNQQAKAKTTKDNEDEVSLISKEDKEHTKKPKDKKEKEKKNVMESDEKKDGPSLLKAIVKTFGRGFLYGWACKLAFDVFRLMEPMVLKSMIAYVEKRSGEASYGYGLALLLFLLGCLTNLLIHHCIRLCIVSSLRLKSGLIAMVYRKALSMNNEARKASTVGEIVNIMSVDCDRIAGISSWIWFLWSVPFSVTGTMVLLWHVVGPAVLPSIGIYALFMWFNAYVAKKNRQYEKEKMEQKDARIKLMNDILNGIKVLKLYAWEASFQKQIEELRAKESEAQRKNHMIGIMHNLMWFTVPMLCTGSVFGTFILMNPSSLLDAQKIFVTISLLNILQGEINILPHIVSHISEATVSIGRISKFLQNPDIDPKNVQRDNSTDKAVSIKSGTFSWNEKGNPTLKDINLDIEAGGLIAVVGQVGSGKSSLISALLGEMEKINGDVNVNGSVAYVPQQAWIQNASARDNILFCSPSDRTKYKKVVDGCALTSDFEIFKAGDLTEIGEKGINLSGGQKQRISLARAVYNNADVYLLDDPLSAVDSHVGKHIFNEVIGSEGLLRNKTRILVTHGVHWLPKVDKIVVLVNGQISEMGSYEQLLNHDGAFAKFLKAFVTTESSDEDSDKEVQTMKNEVYQRRFSKLERSISNYDIIDSELWDESEDFEKKANLVEDETQETGKVSWKVYLSFLRAFGVVFTGIFLVLMLMVRTGEAASNLFLMQWSDDEFLTNTSNANTTEYSHRNYMYLGLYSVSGMFRDEFKKHVFSKDVEAMDHVAGRIRGFSASILCVIYNVVIISYNLPAFGFVIGLLAIPFIVMLVVSNQDGLFWRFDVAVGLYIRSFRWELYWRADLIVESNRPPTGWPHTGNVTFKHFSTRYRDGLDLVVKGISCQIKGGERVGIVGRTGAGKSSLMVSIFRLIEAAGGDIEIDGVNLSEIGLHDLRSNLTILPQDPVLFCGTLRMNLDPFDHYTEEQIWTALEHSHLHKFVSGLEDGLKHECGEGGQNLSVGQRQMVCLTRSLLRKSKVLVLDEATAAVDMETDELIQRTIREEFKGCTILTIAHRLNTIMDYDKIMVLDKGLIKEFDSPKNLLADSTSTFYGMAKDSNLV